MNGLPSHEHLALFLGEPGARATVGRSSDFYSKSGQTCLVIDQRLEPGHQDCSSLERHRLERNLRLGLLKART